MDCDLMAHTTALGTADAAKWVKRREFCSTQPRATISMGISTGPSGRSVTEAAERRRGPVQGRHQKPGTGVVVWDGIRRPSAHKNAGYRFLQRPVPATRQVPATRHETFHIGFVRGAGEISKPLAVS
jgi:hypothetical protein